MIGKEADAARDAPGRPPCAARSRALVLRDAARQPRRQPAGRALPALRAHASAGRESSRRRSPGTQSRPRQALDRTTAFEREHEVAVRLQRSLLSDRLPEVEGVELIGRYNAGGAGLEIGGDWYDAVRRSDGIVHVTVGDVAGHGVTAAVLDGPAAQRLPRTRLRAHLARRRAAAHAAPRRRGRDGDGALPDARSVHAGSSPTRPPDTRRRCSSTATPRSSRGSGTRSRRRSATSSPRRSARPRSSSLPAARSSPTPTGSSSAAAGASTAGIDLLASVLGSSSSLGAEPLADRIFAEVAPHIGSHDDIALLIVRLLEVPQRMDVEVPSDPATHGHDLRRRLRTWLESARAWATTSATTPSSPSARPATTRSSTPTGDEPGPSTCSWSTARARSSIRIADRGSWQPDAPSFERGRGIPLMRAVMDTTTIEHDERGTSVHAEPAAGLKAITGRGIGPLIALVWVTASQAEVAREHGAAGAGHGQGRVRVQATRPWSHCRRARSRLAPRPPRHARVCGRGPQPARRPQPLHVRRLRDHQPPARHAAHARGRGPPLRADHPARSPDYVTRLFEITGIAGSSRVHSARSAALASIGARAARRRRPPELVLNERQAAGR